jgi:serine/threonine protein kinase/Flp pilus assembly protein TadD
MTPERYEQVGQILHAALEREPTERAAFLTEACSDDESLHQEVLSLLASHEQAGDFIEAPLDDIAAAWLEDADPALVPRTFTHYELISLLGRGGMGEVWLAKDNQLGRKVAIKLLPEEFTTDAERVRRFEQEARSASSLNHPNIITIHEIGEAGKTHFIVAEYVEGETLRQRMKNVPEYRVLISETLGVSIQIAEALQAAHEAGIVHRDIKPENVMVRRDGYVKVLDFGLAKLTDPATDNEPAAGESTASGMVMGTPRYMSPEQARGEKSDARTDIFSLGVLIYEMIAGRPPFIGATTSDLIAAILKDEPPPIVDQMPGIPPELHQILSKSMRKDRVERYQTAKELLADLKQLKQRLQLESNLEGRQIEAPDSGDKLRRSGREAAAVTPVPSRRRATMIATAALVLTVIAGLGVWNYYNRQSGITEKDTILLADFENKTGEEFFDTILKQGLAIQLEQSTYLNLFPEAQMRHELNLMKRSPRERVTAELAREICERQNLKALIAGSIAPLGSHYVITLEAINGQSGESLAREQVEAENKESVLRALSQAATQLRQKLGESLGSIQRYNRQLQESTTAKPEAFKTYSQGLELAVSGRSTEALPFFHRAVELDPDFAIAYSHLGILYAAADRTAQAVEYAKKAYELKEHVGEIERFRITHKYHSIVTGDLSKAIEALRLQRQIYPREWTGPQDLSLAYNLIGQYDQAITESREAIRLNPQFAVPYRNLARALINLNRLPEAKAVLTQAEERNLEMMIYHTYRYQIAFIDTDTAEIQRQLNWARGKPYEHMALDWQTGGAAFAGQWRMAQGLALRAIDLAARGEAKEIAARYATEQALRGAALGDHRQARANAVQGISLARSRTTLPRAALALALCGEANQAMPLIDEMTKQFPQDTIINAIWLPVIRAAIELQAGNPQKSIERLQPTTPYEPAAEFWPQYLRGQAYLKLGSGADAAAEFQKILDHRGYAPLSVLYPSALVGVVRSGRIGGDGARSRKAYEELMLIWKDADPDQPMLIEIKKEYQRLK